MKHGFTFAWVAGKHPCFTSPGGTYLIVLDIDDVLPVWSPKHEESTDSLGAFEFKMNFFRDRCGIYINTAGQPVIDCALPVFYHKSKQGAKATQAKQSDVDVISGCSYDGKPKCLDVLAPVTKSKSGGKAG